MRSLAGPALGVLILMAAPAAAAPSTTSVVPIDPLQKVESAALRADRATGRAWVEVVLAKRFASGKEARRPGTAVRVAVPGLSLDRTTGAITLTSGDARLTCATIDGDLQTTGACRIDARVGAIDVDTGFGLARRDGLVVTVAPR